MNANPDLADIIVTYINSVWPTAACYKISFEEKYGLGCFAIAVNSKLVGVVFENKIFASWNFRAARSESVVPTDKKFFSTIKYWARKKGDLEIPKTPKP